MKTQKFLITLSNINHEEANYTINTFRPNAIEWAIWLTDKYRIETCDHSWSWSIN